MYDRHNIMSFYYLIENDDIILNRFVISSFTRIFKSTIFFHWLADNNQIFNIELQHRAKWYTYYVRKKHIFSSLCLQSICFEFHGNAYFSTVKVHQLIFHLHNEIHVNYFCLSNSSLSILTRINDFQKSVVPIGKIHVRSACMEKKKKKIIRIRNCANWSHHSWTQRCATMLIYSHCMCAMCVCSPTYTYRMEEEVHVNCSIVFFRFSVWENATDMTVCVRWVQPTIYWPT